MLEKTSSVKQSYTNIFFTKSCKINNLTFAIRLLGFQIFLVGLSVREIKSLICITVK
jgi:hypothetical protein